MSKIAVTVDAGTGNPRILQEIHKVTGLGIMEIKRRTIRGEAVLEKLLFFNDHDEVAGQVRGLVSGVQRLGGTVRLFELDEGESFDPSDVRMEHCEIGAATLENILVAFDRERQ